MRQAEEAVTQGRAVMMFTIVTIVFVSHTTTPGRIPGSDPETATAVLYVQYLWNEQFRIHWRRPYAPWRAVQAYV